MSNEKKYMLTQELKLLFEGNNSLVYLSQENGLGDKPLILKVIKNDQASQEEITIFNNEFEITHRLNIEGIRKVLKKETFENKPALLLDYIEGETLKNYFFDKNINLTEFLTIACSICQTLGEIHHQNIIHKDLNGNNILISPEGKTFIIDFGISSRINLKMSHLGSPEKLEGTLAYISPEQTGRMNRMVDYRTDLYSLGIIFYEILTKRLPFQSQDAMQLVHSHLAQNPIPPNEVNDEIPRIISDIILKLLAKNAEDRYQSAFGLKYDLEKIKTFILEMENPVFQKINAISFALAQEDFSGKLQIPQKLYGREKELNQILDIYEKACKGDAELLLIAGYSGVGKSALVHEIHKPVAEKRGYFIEGKFDQFQKDVPYYAWIQAFKEFVTQLLTENINDLERWKIKILTAVGSNGKILTDVIPALELVIGEQPEVMELGSTEAQNRFNFVFQNFVNAISKKEHPLVIFIDDWQWADSASLHLLEVLLDNQNEDYLLIIGAYRDNEIDENHPFTDTVEEVRKSEVVVSTLHLDNLSLNSLHLLVAETLKTDREYCQSLNDMIYEKTQGNAFFVNQTLKTLYEENLLEFDLDKKQWVWDIDKIRELNFTDNVVELMTNKVQKLATETQEMLKFASCIGNSFGMDTLYLIDEDPNDDEENIESIKKNLDPALMESLIVPINNKEYRFAHDRIQQAVYNLISEENKKVIHLRIGRLMLENIAKNRQELYVFDIVNQWNLGFELIEEEQDKLVLAGLNLKAGKKAKSSAAYTPALNYLEIAVALLPADIWEKDYLFALDVYTEIAHIAYLEGEFEEMDNYVEVVIGNALTVIDKIRAFEVRMQYFIGQSKLQDALLLGLKVLKLLEVPLSFKAPQNIDVRTLIDLPEMTDEIKLAAMDIMDTIIAPAWSTRPKLFEQICFTMVNLSKRYGNCASSAVGYAFYGGVLCGSFADIETGYAYGKLAVKLVDDFKAKHIKSKVENLYVSTVMHWKESARETIKPHYEAIQVGLETGDIEFASYNIVESSHYQFLLGINLESLKQRYEKNANLILQLKQGFHYNYIVPWQQMILNLLGESSDTLDLRGDVFDEQLMLPVFIKEDQLTLCFIIYQAKSFLCYLMKDYGKAHENILLAENYKSGVAGMMFLPFNNYLYSLILLALYPDMDEISQQEAFDTVSRNQEELLGWAIHAPANYQHKYDLVEAEKMRILKNSWEAINLYEVAIEGAKKAKYIFEEALGNELAADFYLGDNKGKIAKAYMSEAYYLYQLWGAKKKLENLESFYPKLINKSQNQANVNNTGSTIISSNTSVGSNLDMNTIIKASQTMSSEVVLGSLLEKMMDIVIENAGADKGLLILETNGLWYIEAEGNAKDEIKVFQSILITDVGGESEKPMLSNAIINYVIRTQESLVLDNAVEEGLFTKDLYIQKSKSKSILCIPLLNQGKLSGILYFENNLMTGAFTNDRIQILSLLSSQMAISIENALLYENLEEKVQERTSQLNEAYLEIEKKNHDITSSINYAKRIQNAMLPTREKIRESLPECFIYFKPRDIVSGDFYWFSEKILADGTKKVVIAAVDCTGHGVPGAFMSLIGNELLHEIINLRDIVEADKVLGELHVGVNSVLRQNETENRDGMDLSLCIIDFEKNIVDFAGAKNPVFYIQNNEIFEMKASKMPIGGLWGKEEGARVFDSSVIKLSDSMPTYLYMTSDGYPDQFGGEANMKFMKKRLKALLLEIHKKPMDEQRIILRDTMKDWMGNRKQLDDMLVIGMKL